MIGSGSWFEFTVKILIFVVLLFGSIIGNGLLLFYDLYRKPILFGLVNSFTLYLDLVVNGISSYIY